MDFKQFNILDSFDKNADNRPTLENFESDESYDVIEVIPKYKKKTKLSELYKLEFNTDMENAHNAFYDVMATYKIYKNLVK